MIIELSFDGDITKPIISLGHIFSLFGEPLRIHTMIRVNVKKWKITQ